MVKSSNHSGGTLGGISDGSDIVIRAAFKPTPSIARSQHTVARTGQELDIEIRGRHDPIIVPRAVVVVEAMAAGAVTRVWKSFFNLSNTWFCRVLRSVTYC